MNFMNMTGRLIGGIDFDYLRAQRYKPYETRIIDLSTARDKVEMIITGNYIYALEATDGDTSINVAFNESNHKFIKIKKGRGIRSPYYRLWLTHEAQVGKTITLGFGVLDPAHFEVKDSGNVQLEGAVSIGSVYADSSNNIFYPYADLLPTIKNEAFIGGEMATSAGSKYSGVALVNPSASGKTLYITDIRPRHRSSSDYFGAIYFDTYPNIIVGLTLTGPSGPKKIGGASGVGSIRHGPTTGYLGTELFEYTMGATNRAPTNILGRHPIEVPEGYGVISYMTTVNIRISTMYEWLEI